MQTKIADVGAQASKSYCKNQKLSTMFPSAPLPKFPDKFPDGEMSKKEAMELKQQQEYEAEVTVYKLLEMQGCGFIVLHSFKYTHQQYDLFVEHECGKRWNQMEGECDFVIIHKSFVAIIEVKAGECWQEKSFKKTYEKSLKQRQEVYELVLGICKKSDAKEPTILQFTIFTSIGNDLLQELAQKISLTPDEKRTLLTKDDLNRTLWLENELNGVQVNPQIKNLLLGLWCMETNNIFNVEAYDFGKTISKVDDLLRRSTISRRPRQPPSSFVSNAPETFRKCVGIDCLTDEQQRILNDKRKKLLINGPAGSGKTILILGKVIDLAKQTNKKIIVFVASKTAADRLVKVLNNSGTVAMALCTTICNKSILSYQKVLVKYSEDMKVAEGLFIVDEDDRKNSLWKALESTNHIFIDDFHSFVAGMKRPTSEEIMKKVAYELNSSSQRVFWVCNDVFQDGHLDETYNVLFFLDKEVNFIMKHTGTKSLINLSANMRNSYEITGILSSIRGLREELENTQVIIKGLQKERIPPDFLIRQKHGHHIHGPKPNLKIIFSNKSSQAEIIALVEGHLTDELNKLSNSQVAIIVNENKKLSLNGSDTMKIHHLNLSFKDIADDKGKDSINWRRVCKKVISDKFNNRKIKIYDCPETMSREWPAVIGIIEYSQAMWRFKMSPQSLETDIVAIFDQILSRMYITVSRARAYCSIILIIRDTNGYDDYVKSLSSLKRNDSNTRKLTTQEQNILKGTGLVIIRTAAGTAKKLGLIDDKKYESR